MSDNEVFVQSSSDGVGSPIQRLIICEGNEDKAFFDRLIAERDLPKFVVETTAPKRSGWGSNTRFREKLKSLILRPELAFLKHIVLVTDADLNSSLAFETLCKFVVEASYGPAPEKPLQRSKATPSITIVVMPTDSDTGCMEWLYQKAARSTANLKVITDIEYIVSLHSEFWDETRRSKAWLRIWLALQCKDPFESLVSVFRSSPNLIPVTNKVFDPISQVLSSFGRHKSSGLKSALNVDDNSVSKKPRAPRMRNPRRTNS